MPHQGKGDRLGKHSQRRHSIAGSKNIKYTKYDEKMRKREHDTT